MRRAQQPPVRRADIGLLAPGAEPEQVEGVAQRHRSTCGRHVQSSDGEEAGDGVAEDVVAIAGHHVAGARHVHVGGIGTELQEVAGGLLAHQVRHPAPDQQRRHGQVPRRVVELVGPGVRAQRGRPEEHVRVPVPAPPAVGVLAQVLRQTGQVGGAGPVRLVGGDRVGGLVQVGEAGLDPVEHEPDDAVDPGALHPRGDVHQHQRRRRAGGEGALGQQAREPAERRARPAQVADLTDRAGRRRHRCSPSRTPGSSSPGREHGPRCRDLAGRTRPRTTPGGRVPSPCRPSCDGSGRHRGPAPPTDRWGRRTRRRAGRGPTGSGAPVRSARRCSRRHAHRSERSSCQVRSRSSASGAAITAENSVTPPSDRRWS